MDLVDTNTSQQNHVQCSNFSYDEATINKQSTVEDYYHHPLPTPPNRKRRLSSDNEDEVYVPAPKKFKASNTHHRIAIIIPTMAERLRQNIHEYGRWRMNGLDVVLVFNKDEEAGTNKKETVTNILKQYASDTKISFETHSYESRISPNAGIAKYEAYSILKEYLDRPDFQFVLMLDDTVEDIFNTCSKKSIMTPPTEFYHAVEKFALESPVFGGTVAHKGHRKKRKKIGPGIKRNKQKCKKGGLKRIEGAFLQQALIFSCRGTPTLKKHFNDVDEYVTKMGKLSYRKVPFGEDVAFQLSLYEHRVLSKEKSPQFKGIGSKRIPHKSSTKPDKLDGDIKEEMRKMLIYLDEQNALITNPEGELTGVSVIPGGPERITITGKKGERPWREAFNDTFPRSREQ